YHPRSALQRVVAARWPKSPEHRGEREAAAQTIAQGRPGCLGRACGSAACFFLHADHGSGELPAFPAPSRLSRGQAHASLGRIAPRERDALTSATVLSSATLSLNVQCVDRSRAASPAAYGYCRRW